MHIELSFWVLLGTSFLVGSAWIAASTLAADRFGSKVGGLIGGLPSTVVVTLFFIGLTQSPQAASMATTLVPLSIGFSGVFMVVYLFFVRWGLVQSLLIALLIWFSLASLVLVKGAPSFGLAVVVWAILLLGCILAVEKWLRIPSQGRLKIQHNAVQIATRGLFGGTVIAFAVLMSKVAGPVYGGLFAAFPAIFLSTNVITYRTGGAEYSKSVAKALMVSGMVNVTVYAALARVMYLWLGLTIGTVLAIILSLGSATLTFMLIKTRLS